MIESDNTDVEYELMENKRKLRENINRKNILSENDTLNLQRLLTFVEMPSFIKDNTRNHTLLPNIVNKSFLVNQDISSDLNNIKKSFFMQPEKALTRSKSRINGLELRNIVEGGIHIDKNLGYLAMTPELAAGLRQLTCGTLKYSFSMEWRKSYFIFKDITGKLGYCLSSEKNSARSFIICVESYFLKNLLYSKDYSNDNRTKQLQLTENKRLMCLTDALADILWMVGERKKAFVCLSSTMKYVDSSPYYRCDEITERIQIFKFKDYDSLKTFLTKNINYFTTRQYCGCILFLYSIALSRGLQELLEDFEFDNNKSLLTNNDMLTQSAINLILTGYATEFLHNGIQIPNGSDSQMMTPQFGIKKRSEIGYLQYNSPSESEYIFIRSRNTRRASDSENKSSGGDPEQLYTVGSMLKTPIYPIWVVYGNEHFGILFSLRDDLLSHWRAENNFQLYYLNCLSSQQEPCQLSICTRRGRTARFKTSLQIHEETKRIHVLNHIINTKWYGCGIDWNNKVPFM